MEEIVTEPTGHDWELFSHTEATCTESGVTKFQCSICGQISMTVEMATGHPAIEAYVDPDGNVTKYCSICGEQIE